MMTAISRLGCIFWFSLLLVSGCSADIPQAPTNQLIKGPFIITTEWQTINFKKPLRTLPHIQFVELLFDKEKYKPIENIKESEFHGVSSSLKNIDGNKPIRVDVILIDNLGREFKPAVTSTGLRITKLGAYSYLSLSPDGDKGKFYYPKNIKFLDMKIKANMDFRVEHLFWNAPRYYQAPDDSWKDVKESEVVTLSQSENYNQ